MFIALEHQHLCAPAERHVLLASSVLHAAPTERDRLGIWCYKHVAPNGARTINADDDVGMAINNEEQHSDGPPNNYYSFIACRDASGIPTGCLQRFLDHRRTGSDSPGALRTRGN